MINGEQLDCFSEISIDIFEAGKIWSHLIQSPLTVENQTDVASKKMDHKFMQEQTHKTIPSDEIDKLQSYIATLEDENESLKEELQILQHKREDSDRETLLKIIIGMAMDGYSYKPKAQRNAASKKIERATENTGIKVTDETILNKLREAAELVPPQD
jgi:hypothetical protein